MWLDQDGQDTLKDLTTEDSVSEQDLKDLVGVQKAASDKAKEATQKLADLKQLSSARPSMLPPTCAPHAPVVSPGRRHPLGGAWFPALSSPITRAVA